MVKLTHNEATQGVSVTQQDPFLNKVSSIFVKICCQFLQKSQMMQLGVNELMIITKGDTTN
jgi:hypothetical protein